MNGVERDVEDAWQLGPLERFEVRKHPLGPVATETDGRFADSDAHSDEVGPEALDDTA